MSTATDRARTVERRLPPARGRRPPALAILALARVEATRLARHPAFLVGLVASLASTLVRSSSDDSWSKAHYYNDSVAWAFTWMGTLVAAALVAGRERMTGDPDLFEATPLSPGERVLATAVALCGVVAVAGAAVAVTAVLTVREGGFVFGDGAYARAVVPSLAHWVQLVVLVALAGVVGIAVAQLRRGRLFALLLLTLATFMGSAAVWGFQDHPFRVLHPFMFPSYDGRLPADFDPALPRAGDPPLQAPDEWDSTWREVLFDTAALNWHLLYLAGLILVGIWWARRAAERGEPARSRRLALFGLALLVVGGTAQVLSAGVNP